MSILPPELTAYASLITAGRVYVRLVEAANILLDCHPIWTEALLLRLVRVLCRRRLRGHSWQ